MKVYINLIIKHDVSRSTFHCFYSLKERWQLNQWAMNVQSADNICSLYYLYHRGSLAIIFYYWTTLDAYHMIWLSGSFCIIHLLIAWIFYINGCEVSLGSQNIPTTLRILCKGYKSQKKCMCIYIYTIRIFIFKI